MNEQIIRSDGKKYKITGERTKKSKKKYYQKKKRNANKREQQKSPEKKHKIIGRFYNNLGIVLEGKHRAPGKPSRDLEKSFCFEEREFFLYF